MKFDQIDTQKQTELTTFSGTVRCCGMLDIEAKRTDTQSGRVKQSDTQRGLLYILDSHSVEYAHLTLEAYEMDCLRVNVHILHTPVIPAYLVHRR